MLSGLLILRFDQLKTINDPFLESLFFLEQSKKEIFGHEKKYKRFYSSFLFCVAVFILDVSNNSKLSYNRGLGFHIHRQTYQVQRSKATVEVFFVDLKNKKRHQATYIYKCLTHK